MSEVPDTSFNSSTSLRHDAGTGARFRIRHSDTAVNTTVNMRNQSSFSVSLVSRF